MQSSPYSKAALGRTLQCCVAAVVICVLAIGFASTRQATAQHRSDVAEQGVRNARMRLARANEHRGLIDTYSGRFEQLVREGLLIRFDRAVAGDWFEAAIRGRHRALIDDYTIGKDALLTGPVTADLNAFRVVSHRLDFRATASDEDEFADLMNSIEKRLPGTTAQEGCSVSRVREAGSDGDALSLHCALVWYEFAPSNTDLAANQSEPGP